MSRRIITAAVRWPERLEFREAHMGPDFEVEPGLKEFLNDANISADITDQETVFLESLRLDGKRPSLLYYYRELQNLRDPLNLLSVSIGKAAKAGRKTSVVKVLVGSDREHQRRARLLADRPT